MEKNEHVPSHRPQHLLGVLFDDLSRFLVGEGLNVVLHMMAPHFKTNLKQTNKHQNI